MNNYKSVHIQIPNFISGGVVCPSPPAAVSGSGTFQKPLTDIQE